MNGVPTPLFAAVGHQESWDQVQAIITGMRPEGAPSPAIADLRTIVPWIPPRTVSRFSVAASRESARVAGIYVDTFISPEELGSTPTRRILSRVQDAIICAEREGVSVVTLGGFTSILLESDRLGLESRVALTTGNTLTAALILQGVERATCLLGRDLACEDVLIIGATGDVGSACARILSARVRTLLLCARNRGRLQREGEALAATGRVEWSTDIEAMLARATVIIAAASTPHPTFPLHSCRDAVIVCDAGYPKNIAQAGPGGGRHLFWGGMGMITGGLRSDDGILERFYRFPIGDVAHGCMLEGAVLALAGRFEAFSRGRGRIAPARVEEIWSLACQHGVRLAPLFSSEGLWPEEAAGHSKTGDLDFAVRPTVEVATQPLS